MREELERLRRSARRQAAVAHRLEADHLAPLGVTWVQLCEYWFQSLAYSSTELRRYHSVLLERLKPRPEDRETPSPMKLHLDLDAAMSEADSLWRQAHPQLKSWRARHCASAGVSGDGGLADELAGTLLSDEAVVQQLYKLHVAQSLSGSPAPSYTCSKCRKTLCGCSVCSFSHCLTCGIRGFDQRRQPRGGGGGGGGGGRRSSVEYESCDDNLGGEDPESAAAASSLCELHKHPHAPLPADTQAAAAAAAALDVAGCCGGGSDSDDCCGSGAHEGGGCHHQHLMDPHYQHHHGQQHQHAAFLQLPAGAGAAATDKADAAGGAGNNRFCDCCYCEVFGHGGGQQPPVPPKFFEKREQLRQKLKRKKQLPQSAQSSVTSAATAAAAVVAAASSDSAEAPPPVLAKAATAAAASADIDALVEFIEGAKATGSAAAKSGGPSVKRGEAKKTRQRAARKVAEPAAAGQQKQQRVEAEAEAPANQSPPAIRNGRGSKSAPVRSQQKNREDPEEVFKPRPDAKTDLVEAEADEDDVDPVVEQFKSFVMNSEAPKERQKVRLDISSLSLSLKK